jgi:hypothetical protein
LIVGLEVAVSFFFAQWLVAQPVIDYDAYVIHIKRATGVIVIDGALSEEAWSKAPSLKEVIQHFPTDSLQPHSRFEVRTLYDEHYIYFAFTCYDSVRGDYFLQSLRRDFDPGVNDGILVTIDPLGTKQNGFAFGLSPKGVQREGFVANGGAFGIDHSWDNVWISEVAEHEGFWTAELAIPFKSIRYEGGRKQWRINFARWNWKLNELVTWTRFPINFRASSLAHTGILEWDVAPSDPGVNLSLIPYVGGVLTKNYANNTPTQVLGNAGLDIKYALTPSLNLDLTINPDFSNVNVDRQVTNLDRFTLFFPEQRQFFIENSDLFAGFGFSRIRPFFSRRIGLADGRNIPIPFGARVSGTLDDNWRVGLMSIQTLADADSGQETQNYTVAAAQYRVLGRSNIGFLFVNRQGRNYETPGNDYNRVAGVDFNLASDDGRYQGKLFFHQKFSPQQLPDQFATAGWLMYNTPTLELNWNHEYIGQNYKPEVGFVPRTGIFRLQPVARMTFFPTHTDVVLQHRVGMDADVYWDNHSWQLLDRANFAWYEAIFANTSYLSVFAGNVYTFLFSPWDPTGLGRADNRLPVQGYSYWRVGTEFNTDRREPVTLSGFCFGGGYFNGSSLRFGGSVNYRFQPFGSVSLNVQRDNIYLPEPYASAEFTLIGAQIDFTPTRDVFFTTFLQYNTQINNVNVNSRLQWRFAPMSDLFIVYTDNYDARLWGIKNRGVALKFSYWFNV